MLIQQNSDTTIIENFIDPTSEGLEFAVLECLDESGLMESSNNEGENKTGLWERIKTFLVRFKETLKRWWDGVYIRLKALTEPKKRFIHKYKKILLEKDPAGFEYKDYPYNISEGSAYANTITDRLVLYCVDLESGSPIDRQITKIKSTSIPQLSELTAEILHNVGNVNSLPDLKKTIEEKYRGGDKEIKIKNFSSTPVSEMVEELLSADKTIDAMHASYTNIIKGTDRAIKYAELANKPAGDEHQEVGSLRVRLIQSTFSMDSLYIQNQQGLFLAKSFYICG